MGNPTEKAALSIADAAHYSGLSRSSLYRMIDAGTLASLKIGARRLIRRSVLDALLDQASATGPGEAA
ncbi:MAG: excisionase family DNA binding protein [Maricaulis maris]|jgi:excisionase family DNA binding protein